MKTASLRSIAQKVYRRSRVTVLSKLKKLLLVLCEGVGIESFFKGNSLKTCLAQLSVLYIRIKYTFSDSIEVVDARSLIHMMVEMTGVEST